MVEVPNGLSIFARTVPSFTQDALVYSQAIRDTNDTREIDDSIVDSRLPAVVSPLANAAFPSPPGSFAVALLALVWRAF